MRVATIDLGTNSVRFDVHFLNQQGKTKLLHREKLMIRLGQGVFLRGRMDRSAMDRALHAFHRFKRIADELHVERVVAFGTSALREAKDSEVLLRLLKDNTGIEVRIITGAEEARLIAQGILENEKITARRFALVDIGGGSTEISVGRGKEILHAESFQLGTARLQQLFLKRSPPKELSFIRLQEYIQNTLAEKMVFEHWPKVDVLVGSSGTIRAVARILKKQMRAFTLENVSKLVNEMRSMNTTQLIDIPGMEAKRVDMILAGTVLLEEILRSLGAKKIMLTEYSLRDGILEEEMSLARQHKTSMIELHWDELHQKASRFGANPMHLQTMTKLADTLFSRLSRLHKLEPEWRIYLLSTVILRNTGQVIGLANQERHSYYIVKNSDFPAMQNWEHEFVAHLCLHHGTAKIAAKDLAFLGKDKKRKAAFLKICAIVRVLDALDLGPQTKLRLQKVQVTAQAVKLSIAGKSAAGIESMFLERKKKLFEAVFKRKLEIIRV